jgi:regulation of enolase protein 1 (concanavalin A-like superfamily)
VNWVTVGTDSIAMATTVHVGLALTSHDNSRLATATYDSLAVAAGGTPAVSDLPGGWVSQDIGATGAAGTSGTSQGRWTISGAGADVWGTGDAFHFAAQPLAGDGEIVARVSSLTAGHAWAKAGVMIRGSLDASSPHAFLFVTPGGANGVAFQRRATFGDATSHTPAGAGVVPVWLKLTRRGATISASRSDDGVQWEPIESAAIATDATMYAGLAVASHDAGVLTTAEFEGVEVRAAGGLEWMDGDIGSVGHAGLTAIEGDSIGVAASGADIWGRSDAFRYVYRAVTGDFDFTSLVASVDPIDGWTKAGLMVRASPSADSAHASVFATPTTANGVAFQRRASDGAASAHTAGPALSPSVWLRLTRRGAVITAWSRKSAGEAWTAIGSETVALPATALVGVAVTSHNDAALAVAVFERVNLTP